MSLNDHVHQLTNEHLKTGPDNKPHKVPALLTELRNAVTPGNSMSGGGASGPPIPINASALDLLREIETEARKDYHEMTGERWPADLSGLLSAVVILDLTPEWDAYLARVTLEWVDAINRLLWPAKPRRKLVGMVCPSCGWATYGDERKTCLSLGCWDSEGAMKKVGDWDIECGSCEAGWTGEQMIYLLRALNAADVDSVAEVAEVVYR